MQIHITYLREGSGGWYGETGWHWLFYHRNRRRFLTWRGPFASKADAMLAATRINPSAEIVCWDSASLDRPNLGARIPTRPVFCRWAA